MSEFSDQMFQTPQNVTAGFSRLGQVLGGNGQVAQNAYMRGQLQGVQAADVLEQAQRRRDQNVGFSDITPELMQAAMAGDPTALATMASSGLHAGTNFANLGTGMGAFQKQQQERELYKRALGGSPIEALNPALAAMHGQPVALTGIEGNTLIDKYVAPNQQGAVGGNVPTAIGQALMGKDSAEATKAYAGVPEQQALTALHNAQRGVVGKHIVNTANGPMVTDLSNPSLTQAVMANGAPVGYKPAAGSQGGTKLPVGVDQKTVDFARSKLASGASANQVKTFLINHGHATAASYLFGKSDLPEDDSQ